MVRNIVANVDTEAALAGRREQAASSQEPVFAALKAGSSAHWERLFTLLEGRALALAWRILNDSHLAADAVQEAFLRAYRSHASLRNEQQVEHWVMAIIANTARDLARSRKRNTEVFGEIASIEPAAEPEPVPVEGLEEALRAALARLDEQTRVVFLLVHQEGFSYAEVAREFGWPEGTVRSKLHRARLFLRNILRERGEP